MSKSITRVKREKDRAFKPLVYICAPYSGEISKNTERAIQLAKMAYEKGNIPVIPHVQYPFMDDNDPLDRKNALLFCTILMGKCQEVWVLGDHLSPGMQQELALAKKRFQKIRYFDRSYVEVKMNA